eukprot:Nitzschia sp. Nitz4//scaffold3_size479765//170762//173366//NITZ4_000070-RA/size479765-processed-gene-0.306-mRNA-1//-1//CDS//3329550668//1931//frame0
MREYDDSPPSDKITKKNDWTIPSPPDFSHPRSEFQGSTSSTPLIPVRQRRTAIAKSFFPPSQSYQDALPTTPHTPISPTRANESLETSNSIIDGSLAMDQSIMSARPTGLTGFFFGFMYEDPFAETLDSGADEATTGGSLWNPLNMALCGVYLLTSAATTVPVLLIPTIGQDLLTDPGDVSGFASRAASSAVLGTAFGKFLNGPVGDVYGARRTSVLYSLFLAISLVAMAACNNVESITWACFFVEFFQSVQWPCVLITLATHFGPTQSTTSTSKYSLYEGGIYIVSIASRFGTLLAIPLFLSFLHQTNWRIVCLVGAWISVIATSVAYLFTADSPHRIDEPQNALHPLLLQQIAYTDFFSKPRQCIRLLGQVMESILFNNLVPSLSHVLKSGTFWIVALAHTGSSMIRTSERILSSYYRDTSMGFLSEQQARSLSIFSSLGTILGLAIVGTIFGYSKERQRKRLVSRLYMVATAACYVLALLAVPPLYTAMDAPGLVLFFQIFSSFAMAFAIAVVYYHIPGLVGSSFGNHKGLFAAYVEGVAYGLSSFVWKVVATSVESGQGGGGWAYGWAAVALLLIPCAILMVEFMEHYFVRPSGRHQGTKTSHNPNNSIMPEKKQTSFLNLLGKFFSPNSKPTAETFPELPAMVIWTRCILAILHSVYVGLYSVRPGGVDFLLGLNLVAFVPMTFCNFYLGVDHESYNDQILFAGLANGLALMMLIWTYLYTLNHEEDEMLLGKVIASLVNETIMEDGTVVDEPVPVAESEF